MITIPGQTVITYGVKKGSFFEHTFGNPHAYLRVGDRPITKEEAHQAMKQALLTAFDAQRRDSILGQILTGSGADPEEVRSGNLDFINWGNVQMVYLATINMVTSTVRLAVLINQPQIPLGVVRAEFENLRRLAQIDPYYIVRPYVYFVTEKHEAYASPYLENAQCIFSGHGYQWGVFNPHPVYHFESFLDNIRPIVTSSMLALLVKYYDAERGRGLAQTHLSGDDFMLTQDFTQGDPESVLPNMRLAGARGWIETPLAKYLDILRSEFAVGTHYRDSEVVRGEIQVNHKSGLPLTSDEIEAGIELGLKLREAA